MNTMIFNPLEEFESKYRDAHSENMNKFFDNLVQQSGIDIEKNRETIRMHQEYKENLAKLKKKLGWWKFLRVLMCITLVLIPLVIMKTTPKIRGLREDIENADKRIEELFAEAVEQMLPLNILFTEMDALKIVEETIPLISFYDHYSAEQETDMRINYDFDEGEQLEQSTVGVVAGRYNDNPFLFENRLIHRMGQETYHGSRTVYWTETYRDSDGRLRTRQRSQTLHASVTKPKPFYNTRVVLTYCAQGGPELSFSRDASHLEKKSDKSIEKIVKKGEKQLKKKTDKAISENSDFMSMSNSQFEVLFNALDRTNEVQFRTLFTPLAQTNMVALLRSQVGFGDDFDFIKRKRTNRIIAEHSQGRLINLLPEHYISHSFDVIKESFITKNTKFFKDLYFDFAPIWAIPLYQERPVHSLDPLPDYSRMYSLKQFEVLANAADAMYVVHPSTRTQAILKSSYVGSTDNADETCITAYSYDIERRVDYVSVLCHNGQFYDVPVEWDEYLPLEESRNFYISKPEQAGDKQVIARRDGLCIYKNLI